MIEIKELQNQFRVENIDPYGKVVVIPYDKFQYEWEKDLEAQGHRVFTESFEGVVTFFVRLSKGKSKVASQTPVSPVVARKVTNNTLSSSVPSFSEHEGRFVRIPITLLESSPQAPREVYEDIESLAATIKKYGVLEPLIVTARKDKNSYLVLIGERRFRACKKAELEAVPCIVKDELSDQEIEELQLIENVQRHDLKPFEEIKLIKQLSDRGMTQHEMCATTGLSHGTVDVYLKIARTLPVEIQREIVKEGSHNPKELTLTKAVMLAESKANPATIEETVKQIQKDGLKPKALAKKLAQQGETKLHRVRESRIFWRELTRSVKKYAEYWNDYTTLKEYEEADAYHLELHVKLPKDLKTT